MFLLCSLAPAYNCAKRKRCAVYNLGMWTKTAAPLLVGLVALGGVSQAEAPIHGPVEATLLRVIDGDTLLVRARIWIAQEVETGVRIRGVDAPEVRARCPAEARLAEAAARFVAAKLADGRLLLHDVDLDKYGGRVVARVETAAGEDIATALLAAGLARPYDGGRKSAWCG